MVSNTTDIANKVMIKCMPTSEIIFINIEWRQVSYLHVRKMCLMTMACQCKQLSFYPIFLFFENIFFHGTYFFPIKLHLKFQLGLILFKWKSCYLEKIIKKIDEHITWGWIKKDHLQFSEFLCHSIILEQYTSIFFDNYSSEISH